MTPAKIKKELELQTTIFEEKVKSDQVLKGNIKFQDFAEDFMLDYAEKQLSPKTVERYYALLGRINAAIGHIRLAFKVFVRCSCSLSHMHSGDLVLNKLNFILITKNYALVSENFVV
jgi:hypothetical protein